MQPSIWSSVSLSSHTQSNLTHLTYEQHKNTTQSHVQHIGKRLLVNEVSVKPKTAAEVLGEKIVRPILNQLHNCKKIFWSAVDKVCSIFDAKTKSTCSTNVLAGAIGTAVTKHPAPVVLGTMSCLSGAVASKMKEADIKESANSDEERIEALKKENKHVEVVSEVNEQIKMQQATAKMHFQQGVAWKNLGNISKAKESFAEAAKDLNYAFHPEKKETDDCANNPKKLKEFKEKFLKTVGMNVPDHFDYIAMSALAYYEKGTIEGSIDPNSSASKLGISEDDKRVIAQIWKVLKEKKWSILNTSKDFGIEGSGYYGIAFKNLETGQIIIAHRGSAEKFAIVNDIQILANSDPDQLQFAREFTDKIQKMDPGIALAHTGHSLGAALAENLAFKDTRIAVTADSPGIAGTLQNKYVKEGKIFPHILSYLSNPNMVNACCGQHIGEQRTVAPIIEEGGKTAPSLIDEGKDAIKSYVKKYITSVIPATVSELLAKIETDVLKYHSILNILQAFDHETGSAKNFRQVTRWPISPSQRLAFERICKENNLAITAPNPMDQNVQAKLNGVYKTIVPDEVRIPLSSFSENAQNLLKTGLFYNNFSVHFVDLYEIQNDSVVVRSDPSILTAQQFKNYIEHKTIEARHKEFFSITIKVSPNKNIVT